MTRDAASALLRAPWWRSPHAGILGLGIALVVVGLVLGREDWLTQGAFALTLSIAATGLGIALGLAGEYLLGVSFIVAAGAYPTAVLTVVFGWSFWGAALVGVVVATLIGLVLSLPGLRLSQFYFGMVGFFMVFLIPSLVEVFAQWTNGSKGLAVYKKPELFGIVLDERGMFLLATVALVLTLLATQNIRQSPLAVQMRRMRDAPYTLASTGVEVWRVRFGTYAITAVMAGVAGAVYSHISIFLQPGQFGFSMTMVILAAVVVGGARTLLGPTIGLIILYIGPRLIFNIEGIGDIVYGTIVLLSVLLFRGGVVQAVRDAGRRWGRTKTPVTVAADSAEGDPDLLVALLSDLRGDTVRAGELGGAGLRRSFGAVRGLAFEDEDAVIVRAGSVTLLLGPNGSGKTTLLNVLSGLVRADEGQITRDGAPATATTAAQVARSGVRRSFQTPILPDELSPVDILAATIAAGEHVRFGHWLIGGPRASRARRRSRRLAGELAAAAALGAVAEAPATALTSGQRRMIDVLSALVSPSSYVLLDEPAAGLGAGERRLLAATIRGLAVRGVGFLVVEHDLELALGLADRVVVMAEGRPVVQGSPAEIQHSVQARRILLGEGAR